MKGDRKMRKIISLVLMVLLLVTALAGCGKSGYKDGTYEGQADGMHPLKVSVKIAGGKITEVKVVEHKETKGISEPALEKIPAAIVEKNSTKVDAISGATRTSTGIIDAVNKALEGAK
jgi:uncharacterized protein with FMN-binding domain